jgi:hypothetical protein
MAKKSKQEQVATEIDRFFGGWKDDPRTTEEIMQLRSKKIGVTFDSIEKWFVFVIGHDDEDIWSSLRTAVDTAHKKINLYHYDIVVMPKNRNKINQYMIRYIYRFNQPRLYHAEDILSKPIDDELSSLIRQKNVLIVEDVTTSGSELNEILRTFRNLNGDNEIAIFSLIKMPEEQVSDILISDEQTRKSSTVSVMSKYKKAGHT